MKNWKEVVVSASTSIRATIEVIDRAAIQAALVLDDKGRLLGIVTDGDIRRAILKSVDLEQPVNVIMNSEPLTADAETSRSELLNLMVDNSIRHVPIISSGRVVIGLKRLETLLQTGRRTNTVVLMAGGLGRRLHPLTATCPKPLLKIGSEPLLEKIVKHFIKHGFYSFIFSVGYKAEMITQHFGDGSKWNVNIDYLHEEQPLGTAGSLGLIDTILTEPFFVMNGDVLTDVNLLSLLEFHIDHQSKATMCVREYDFQVPYGVVKTDGHLIQDLREKPVQRFFVNAGIYVLEPPCLEYIPRNSKMDMPTLFKRLSDQAQTITAFPLREKWIDIGRFEDFERARNAAEENSGPKDLEASQG